MPRPLTKGPPVQFRLPLELHELLEQRFAREGETVNQAAARILEAALAKARAQ